MAFMTKRKVFSKHQIALGLMGSTISCQHFFFGRDESVRRWKREEIIQKKYIAAVICSDTRGYMSHLSHGRGIFHEEVPVVDELFCQLMVNAVEDSITKVCHVALATSDTSKVITRQNNTKYTFYKMPPTEL